MSKNDYHKTTLCIRMLEYLYSYDKRSIQEIASYLDTNPRNIPEYRKELQDAGYIIDSVQGKNGGYILQKKGMLPAVNLTYSEKIGLKAGLNYLSSREDFMQQSNFNRAMAKVAAQVNMNQEDKINPPVIKQFTLSMDRRDIANRYISFGKCIISRNRIRMKYIPMDCEAVEITIHPYKLFMYDDAWYVIAYCEEVDEIGYYKLNRVISFDILQKTFRVSVLYKERDYLDEYGMRKDGASIPVKLLITGRYAAHIGEFIYGKNQEIKEVDENTTLLSVTMQNEERILNFIMGFGKDCRIVEPDWLRESLKKKCLEIMERNK